jgi:hypothetical protein
LLQGRREIGIVGVALLVFLLSAPAALAAPTLGVEIGRFPEQINRGDESVRYEVEVTNTSPADPTSGALNLAISLPPGLTLKAASGAGWSCSPALLSCDSSAAVPAGGSYPVLGLSSVWIDATAPDTVHVGVSASGAGAASAASAEDSFSFGPAVPFGLLFADTFVADEAGAAETQAGAHPYEVSGAFETPLRRGPVPGSLVPVESLHGGVTELPAGMIANPRAAEAVCDFAALELGECPIAAAVGGVKAFMEPEEMPPGGVPNAEAPKDRVVYRLRGEEGFPATFGFKTEGLAYVIRFRLRSDGDYGLSQVFPLIPQSPIVYGIGFAFCGYGVKLKFDGTQFDRCTRRTDLDANPKAFLTLATSCANGPPLTRFAVDSWIHRGRYAASGLPDLTDPNWSVIDVNSPALTGCAQLTEEWTGADEPSFSLGSGGRAADSPATYTARLHIPQDGLEDPSGLATSHLEDATVSLPPGLSLNPAFADGLKACSEEQIGLIGTGFPSPSRIRFDGDFPDCPDASKIGTVSVDTPLFAEALGGSIYLAAQRQNPFGSEYAAYVAIEAKSLGIIAKLPARIELDPGTGQITATLPDGPQLPFEDIELSFFGGGRSVLASPVTCGDHEVSSALTPWSAADPDRPRADEIARPADRLAIDSGPHGSACVSSPAERPLDAGFSAASTAPVAGAESPFRAGFTRPDGSQELDRLEVSPPPGFVASLRGVAYCSEARIAAATAGSGRAERGVPSCPPASLIGTVSAGAGPGATPLYVTGNLYLGGPYKGAPLSAVAIIPALAGPFDLGNVVIRSALEVDRGTARITAVTDRIPPIVGGIPLRLRDVRVRLDRPGWGRNPTSCNAMSVDAAAFGSNGAVTRISSRFQVEGCAALGFKPKLALGFSGAPTRRGGHPRLRAVLKARSGDANIRRATMVLPKTEYLDNSHIRTICTRLRFAIRACPARSIYGYARAWSPLLDRPLRGPVYLRSSDGKLPDLVASLDGQIQVDLAARIDSVRGRIRIGFEALPDVPLRKFELTMPGGRRGLLVNNTELCRARPRADVFFRGQNGKARQTHPVVKAGCGERKRR